MGFAVPGTLSKKYNAKPKKKNTPSATMIEDIPEKQPEPVIYDDNHQNKIKVRKRVKLKL